MFPTLTEYFDQTFESIWCKARNLDPKTLSSYRESLKHWRNKTGDPPVDQITQVTIGDFVAAMRALPGKKKGTTFFASSLQKHARQLDTCIKTLGPASRENKLGQELLTKTPFFPEIKVPKNAPHKLWTQEEIFSMYRAASKMTKPQIEGVSPVDWWRCVIVCAFYTGERITALMHIEFAHIFQNVLTIPPEIMKNDKGIRHYLPQRAIDHIERIRTDRQHILLVPNYSKARRMLYAWMEKLQVHAEIPKTRRWRFHCFRSTQATNVASGNGQNQQNLKNAQLALGHSSSRITSGHYIAASVQERQMFQAIKELPSPVPPEFENVPVPIAVQLPQAPSEPTRRRSWMDRFA